VRIAVRSRRFTTLLVVAVSLLGSGALIWHASYAAFTATTATATNTWTAGSVTLTNDRSVSAAFSVTAARPDASATVLAPGASGPFVASSTSSGGSACVKVTYTGTLTADVRLYVTLTESGVHGGLGQYLLFDVDTGTDTSSGGDLSCATFTDTGNANYIVGSASNSTTYLSAMGTTYDAGATGWTGATANTTKWYRFSWLLPANVSDNAQSQQVQATFTWESHGT